MGYPLHTYADGVNAHLSLKETEEARTNLLRAYRLESCGLSEVLTVLILTDSRIAFLLLHNFSTRDLLPSYLILNVESEKSAEIEDSRCTSSTNTQVP